MSRRTVSLYDGLPSPAHVCLPPLIRSDRDESPFAVCRTCRAPFRLSTLLFVGIISERVLLTLSRKCSAVSLLYGLEEADVVHIFETFHEGWDCQPRLKAVLTHYKAWAAKA